MLNPRPIRSLPRFVFSIVAVASLAACGPSGSSSPPADADVDGVSAVFDCDDSDPTVSGMQTYFVDADEDGVGGTQSEVLCDTNAPVAYSLVTGDCDDTDPRIQVEQTYQVDLDGDGVGGPQTVSLCEPTAPTGFSIVGGDCDDDDPGVSTGSAYYTDADSDGYGAGAATFLCTSSPPAGLVSNGDDPDDADARIIPDDFDGDGFANSNDCAQNDATAYSLNFYYEDADGDGLGSGEVAICGPLPAPELSGYVSNDLDDCPLTFNSDRDFDEDGLDDACDADIHVLRSMTLTEDVQFPEKLALGGVRIDYRMGDNGRQVEVRFEGATLRLADCVSVTLAGGSSLVFETKNSASYAALDMGSPSGGPGNCETSIRGENASNASRLNRVRFLAGRIFAGSRARFRDLNEVVFTTAAVRNAQNAQVDHGSDIYLEKGSGQNWAEDEYLTFIDFSRADAALVVEDQYLDLTDIRFVDNDAYPLECIGRDYRFLPGTTAHRSRSSRTTCQTAISRSHFKGNRRAGPLLSTFEAYESDVGVPNIFDRRRNFFTILFGDPGTNTIYVRSMTFANESNVDYDVIFRDLDVLPYVFRESGNDVISEDAEIRIGTASRPGPNVSLTQIDVVDVPIVVLGEGDVDVSDSKLGPVLIKTDEGAASGGPRLVIDESELDFRGSEFRQYVLALDDPGDSVTAGIVFDNFGGRNPGTLVIRDSDFKLNKNIDHAILFLSGRDPEDSISIDDDSFPGKTDFDDLVRAEDNDCCTITPFFGLK